MARNFSKGRRTFLPLLGGAGRSQDGRLTNFVLVAKLNLWLTTALT
jgi:hypothetical protein